jgi:hypothetical protein
MSAPASVPVPETPLSGTVDVAVEMIAPDGPGTYQGFWQMQGPSGGRFGDRVYVMIEVPAPAEPSPEEPAPEAPSPKGPLPPPPPPGATATPAPSTETGNFHIVNATGDRLEVAFDGTPDFFFVLGNYGNVVEVAPGDYIPFQIVRTSVGGRRRPADGEDHRKTRDHVRGLVQLLARPPVRQAEPDHRHAPVVLHRSVALTPARRGSTEGGKRSRGRPFLSATQGRQRAAFPILVIGHCSLFIGHSLTSPPPTTPDTFPALRSARRSPRPSPAT